MGTHNVITVGEEKVSDGGYARDDQAMEREGTWARLEEVAEQERLDVIRLRLLSQLHTTVSPLPGRACQFQSAA